MHRKFELFPALLVIALATSACGSKSDASASGDVSANVVGKQESAADAQGDDGSGSEPNKAVAAIDPCALLTNAEIVDQLEKAQEPNQLAAFRAKGGGWKITPSGPLRSGLVAKTPRFAPVVPA